MKKIIKYAILLCIIVTSIFMIIFINKPRISLENIENNQVISPRKLWIIRFDKSIIFDNKTKNSIKIKNDNGELSDISLILGQDKKSIIIVPPIKGYKTNTKYTLEIGKDIHNEKLNLLKDVNINFSVKQKKYKELTKEFREPKVGDIVGREGYFRGYKYFHYAIYIGNNKIIHYWNNTLNLKNSEIREDNIDQYFTKGNYFVLNCNNLTAFTPEEIVLRAKSRLGERAYNLATNNCEHFAMWCNTDEDVSYQVLKVEDINGIIFK